MEFRTNQERDEAVRAAQQIVENAKSENRDLTPTETKTIDETVAASQKLAGRQAKGAALVQAIGGVGDAGDDTGTHLNLRAIAEDMTRGMKSYAEAVSPFSKGLTPSGETIVNVPLVNTDPLAGGAVHERAPRLVDVLTAARREGPVYSFLRQVIVAAAGSAGVVAPGEAKPVKKLGIERVDSRLRVIAVLSEPVDKYLLEDAANLRTWVGSELADAVEVELENQVLAGDGTGENFQGLATLSGVQTQAFVADPLVTVQHGLSKLQALGIEPEFVALPAADWLAIQTTRNASGSFDVGGPIDATKRTAWGTPIVIVAGLAAGTGYVIGRDTMVISTDNQGVRVEWGTPGDTFSRNQVVGRVEGRFNLDVPKPHGIVKLDLSA